MVTAFGIIFFWKTVFLLLPQESISKEKNKNVLLIINLDYIKP
jgi:hypothetical protein